MSQNITNTANINASNSMFCFQCEQTAGCTACTGAAGVCGKTADVARLQDDLTGTLVALARAESGGRGDTESDGLDRVGKVGVSNKSESV